MGASVPRHRGERPESRGSVPSGARSSREGTCVSPSDFKSLQLKGSRCHQQSVSCAPGIRAFQYPRGWLSLFLQEMGCIRHSLLNV